MTLSVKTVAVLFARADSIYKTMPGCDVYDQARDARTWPGGAPIVGHPPCRSWGTLAHMAHKATAEEKALAPWCVDRIREWGGVLEHPKRSKLWPHCGLPRGTERDQWGGWTLPIFQQWFGHRAEKATLLYIVGCEPADVPPFPLVLGRAERIIAGNKRRSDGTRIRKGDIGWRPDCTDAEREHTPPALADWLVELARRCAIPR
jgi:hypothetical protein